MHTHDRPIDGSPGAGKLIATTVRFDGYWWPQVGHWSTVLGIAKARLIHDATIERIVGLRTVEHLGGEVLDHLLRARLGELLRQSDRRLQSAEAQIARMAQAQLISSRRRVSPLAP